MANVPTNQYDLHGSDWNRDLKSAISNFSLKFVRKIKINQRNYRYFIN